MRARTPQEAFKDHPIMWSDTELDLLAHPSLADAIRGDRDAAKSLFESRLSTSLPGTTLEQWLWAVATVMSRSYARVRASLATRPPRQTAALSSFLSRCHQIPDGMCM